VSLQNRIERELGLPIRLRAGAPGALDIFVNGEQVFSKRRAGRLPAADEVIQQIRRKLSEA
jgi:selT/selW/selH-like putative selenoprotein